MRKITFKSSKIHSQHFQLFSSSKSLLNPISSPNKNRHKCVHDGKASKIFVCVWHENNKKSSVKSTNFPVNSTLDTSKKKILSNLLWWDGKFAPAWLYLSFSLAPEKKGKTFFYIPKKAFILLLMLLLMKFTCMYECVQCLCIDIYLSVYIHNIRFLQ